MDVFEEPNVTQPGYVAVHVERRVKCYHHSDECIFHGESIMFKQMAEEHEIVKAWQAGYIILKFEWERNIEAGGEDLWATLGKRP